ncbi:MAG: anti-sigma factor family protein [Candidatus Binatia bacterium]
MNCEQAQEWITALVDNEVSAEERAAIERHIGACRQCQQAYEQERAIKQQVRLASAIITAPAALRQAVEGAGREPSSWLRVRRKLEEFLTMPYVRPALAVALLLLVIYPLMFRGGEQRNIALAALSTHAAIESGHKTVTRVDDVGKLKAQLVQAVSGRFAPMGFDLSMMQLYPVAGFVEKIGGRDVLVTVYQGAGQNVTCFTFLGSESDAPADAMVFFDDVKKISFYSFSQGDFHAVMHREGELICVMASKMPAADLLALVRGKARHS